MHWLVGFCLLFATKVLCVKDSERASKLVNILYANVDTNDDGLITAEEIANVFPKYDTDGDGVVNRKEFVQTWSASSGASSLQSVAVFSLLDGNHDGTMDKDDITSLYKYLDRDGNGEVIDFEFIRQFGALLSGVPFVMIFMNGDKNSDGFITELELEASFQIFDANRDGNIDASEFINLWVARGYSDVATAKRLFGKLNINGDDYLDRKNDIVVIYKQLDTNDDGNVTQEEFVTGWAKIMASISKRP